MTTDDDWVKHATTDDGVVAELLLRLSRTDKPPPALGLDWSVRQRRSRAPSARQLHFHHDGDAKRRRRKRKKKAVQTRASPTTPLSWSGATTSVSGGGGSEESSKPVNPAGGARSKVSSVKNEITTASKRPRKKKTLAELKEEETLLLKERKKLRKEADTMRLNIQIQRATKESLNRLKLDLESKQKVETFPTTNGHDTLQCSFASHELSKELEIRETGFPLPDLNLPAEGDLDTCAAFCGIS